MTYQEQITIKGTVYNIIQTQKITSPSTSKYAHTQLLLTRGNGSVLYQAYIRNDNTIKNVINTGARLSK